MALLLTTFTAYVDLGVSRQRGYLWFDSSNHQHPWYIGNRVESVDSRLTLVHPPNEVTRFLRSVRQRAYWKGSEWHWWLLLYSPVVLFGILPQSFYGHLMLLVEASSLLVNKFNNFKARPQESRCLFITVCTQVWSVIWEAACNLQHSSTSPFDENCNWLGPLIVKLLILYFWRF